MKRTISTSKILALFLPIQIVLVQICSYYPSYIEQYYSRGLYLHISKLSRFLLGWIPISVGDLCYIIAILLSIKWIVSHFTRLYKRKQLITIAATFSTAYFLFHLLWGLNYYRTPLHENLNYSSEYTTNELIKTTQFYLQQANLLQYQITQDSIMKVENSYSQEDIFEHTVLAYQVLQKNFPELNYTNRSIKKSIISLPLTYMGFSGYLNPFTNEAQVNYLIPNYYFPFVSCHEEAHQLGYAAENEANFIGCLASLASPNLHSNYAGTAAALRFCMRELYYRDAESYEELGAQINKGILDNFQENRDFWSQYQNPLEPILKKTYDQFLKVNHQDKGIKSYSYVVALLVNHYKSTNHLTKLD